MWPDRMGPNNIVMAWTPDNKIVYRSRQHSFNDFKGKLYIVNPDGDFQQNQTS